MANTKPGICPCTDCICVPMCRHKPYMRLFRECNIVDKYAKLDYNVRLRTAKSIDEIEDILKPTNWVRNLYP
jgi:hypothetical protein